MKALRITKQNTSWVIALDHPGVLNATVNCVELPERNQPEHTELILGGLDCETNTHIRWNPIELVVGDQIMIEVLDDCEGDSPDESFKQDHAQDNLQRMQYVRDEAARLGWTITESKEDAEQGGYGDAEEAV